MRIRVILVDDQEAMRRSLRDLLAQTADIEVIAVAVDGQEAIDLTRALKPDLVVMDIGMPRLNGIEATRLIVCELPNVKVIALSVHSDKRLIARMRAAGASKYVLKDFAFEELAPAIRSATRCDG